MKVIVNAVGYVGQEAGAGGAGVFLQYLADRLATIAEVDVLVAPGARTFPEGRRPGRFIELPFLTGDILRQLRSGPTIVLDPFGGLPCAPFPEDMALCAVVHDLMHLERPHFFTRAERAVRTHCFREGLQRADAVIAFTEDQARAIRHWFPGTRPEVIPHLPYMALAPAPADPAAALPPGLGRFVLFPAVRWPHKNHKTLIEAFGAHVRQTGSDLRLVMTGGPCAESRFSYLPPPEAISDQVIDLGRVSDAAIRALFDRAEAVLFPTQYEGFGIPVLEAAHLGKMVVASRLACFDEILGEGNYRAVEDTLCHLRWMEALEAVEQDATRAGFEAASRRLRETRLQPPERFLAALDGVLRGAAERYAGPARFPSPHTRHGDRITARIATGLRFADIHGTATAERGTAHPVLGPDPSPQAAYIFRSAAGPEGTARRSCLRAEYALPPQPGVPGARTLFSAWLRLHGESGLEGLRWTVNDGQAVDLLPELRQGHWHLCRLAVPRAGHVDLRGVRGGVTEVPGFEIEIHDPCVIELAPMPEPVEPPLAPPGLTVIIAGLEPETVPPGRIAGQVAALEAALGAGGAPRRWIAVVPGVSPATLPAEAIPANLRFLTVGPAPFERGDADSLLTPYEPVADLLLLEAEDLETCRHDPACLAAIAAASRPGGGALPLPPAQGGFWRAEERGRVIAAAHRVGQPVPLLDPAVVAECLARAGRRRRPRFAVIETDRTSEVSHHGTVTSLFLRGAEELGWQPVLGLHGDAQAPIARSAGRSADGIETWEGFSTQVYGVGSAEAFAEEMARFVEATGLGPDDLVFLHSLSPQILLGAARFLAATPAGRAPRVAMRFFSTAEAMRGHKLSYVRILRSIMAVRAVRERMRFFCESRNLVAYYEEQVGVRFPLLFNPEHPGLALARDSAWFDPALGGGKVPMLAYFGEAREEKGFEALPAILSELLAADALSDHRFLVQTGSNQQNQTPKMARAKAAIAALRARYPERLRTFESVETAEQLYFLMKHARAVIAPYRPESYGKRGTGITLEALQMGLDVYAFAETDLYATFRGTGRLIAVPDEASFARTILRHRSGAEPAPAADPGSDEMRLLRLGPAQVVERLLALATAPAPSAAGAAGETVLWVGNDTFGEGNSSVYAAQKMALAALGHDCLELFVPWPDRNWSGVDPAAYDTRIYGFDSGYDGRGLAWVARPRFVPEQLGVLEEIERHGPTYGRLRDLNRHFALPGSLARAIAARGARRTLLNYAHLLPVVADTMPLEDMVCETHDIMAYQHAVRRGDGVSLAEKIEEFSDLSRLPRIVAISAAERREIAGACGRSRVEWRLPPFVPEPAPAERTAPAHADWVRALASLGGVPDEVARPTPLMLRTHVARPDLQALFPLSTPTGRAAYFRWCCFFGQQELPPEAFGLSRRQVAWLIEGVPEDAASPAAGVGGLLRMLLAAREDLRRAFLVPGPECGAPMLRREAFEGWAAQNLPREYPLLAPAALAERAERFFARAGAADLAMLEGGGAVLTAVLEAGPAIGAIRPAEAEPLVQRIAAVEAVDLALVGSGHPSNIESFRWFLDEVWLKALAPRGRNLFVLGNVCEHLRGYQHRGLFLLGRCERLGPLLAAARACPLPVVVGSGSPIKTIPAMALNGAVTVTEHIERAFALADYGIPAVSDAREFAEDVAGLLADDAFRARRQAASARYVAENLRLEDYTAFWGGMLG